MRRNIVSAIIISVSALTVLLNFSSSAIALATLRSSKAIEAEIDSLGASQHRIDELLIGFTALVIVGLWLELRSERREFWIKLKYERTGLGPSELHETSTDVLRTIVGAIFVLAGIVGELWEEKNSLVVQSALVVANKEDVAAIHAENDATKKTVTDAEWRAHPYSLQQCTTWHDVGNVTPPKKIEIFWYKEVRSAETLVLQFRDCFHRVGWPEPTDKSVSRKSLVAATSSETGITVDVFSRDKFDIAYAKGTPQRALADAMSGTIPDTHLAYGLDVDAGVIRIVIAPRQ